MLIDIVHIYVQIIQLSRKRLSSLKGLSPVDFLPAGKKEGSEDIIKKKLCVCLGIFGKHL